MNKKIFETNRLYFREMTKDDFYEISKMLKDIEVMYAWEKSFSDEEVNEWIDKNIDRYKHDGYSYFLAINKYNNDVVGLIGVLTEIIEGSDYMGVAYILNKSYLGQGYATEGVNGCLDYGFNKLNAKKIIAQIRPCNIGSIKVAQRLNMTKENEYTKLYDGKEMVHIIYSITKDRFIINK